MDETLNEGADAPLDDAALFNSITSSAPAEVESEPAPQPEAKPEPEIAADPAPQAAEGRIPPARLKEEADARRRAEARAEELERRLAAIESRVSPPPPVQEQPKPDIFDDPAAFVRSQVQEDLQQLRAVQYESLRLATESRYGEDKVKAAVEAFDAAITDGSLHPADHAKVTQSRNPYHAALQWFDSHRIVAEVGSDPAAYKERLRQELLADPAFRQQAIEAARNGAIQSGNVIAKPAVTSLPSLGKVGTTALPSTAGEMSDAELFQSITSQARDRRTGRYK